VNQPANTDTLHPPSEQPINPGLPIIDPHHHLWDYAGFRYFTEEFLQDASGGHNIVQTVFVECMTSYREDGPPAMKPVGETEFVCRIANATAESTACKVAAGIVGYANLMLGSEVAPVLEAHLAAGHGRFRGIRHASGWDSSDAVPNGHTFPPQGLLLDPIFREGFACLAKYGLSFDACAYHPQLSEVADLARAFPETRIILDHTGTPLGVGPYAGRRPEVFEDWKRGIKELAVFPNIAVKLGGLGMDSLCGFGWSKREKPAISEEMAQAFAPYYLFCIDQFGPDRCMFESNFPVDKSASSYTVLWNSFKRIVAGFSPTEKAALFHDTAKKWYRL